MEDGKKGGEEMIAVYFPLDSTLRKTFYLILTAG
jgi:hypothetical protein